jgi:hypothetical protein
MHRSFLRYTAVAAVFFAAAVSSALAGEQRSIIGGYHERTCPSVNVRTMTRLTRSSAEAAGLVPAAQPL